MKSQKIYLIIGLSAMLALSAASFAQTNNAAAGAATSDQTQQDQAQQAPPTGFGTNARLALSWAPGYGVVRSKGVTTVSNPTTGIICITSAVSLNLSKIYPLVSVEWGNSGGNALMAFWRDTTFSTKDCGPGLSKSRPLTSTLVAPRRRARVSLSIS
jgi:hypothetical protein